MDLSTILELQGLEASSETVELPVSTVSYGC
jgi:hypothetical protein